VLNIKKSQKYLLSAVVVASLLMLVKLLTHWEQPSIALHRSLLIHTQVANLLPKIGETNPTTTIQLPAESVTKIAAPTTNQSIATVAKPLAKTSRSDNSITLKYHDIAQQTGYLEEYPEVNELEITKYQGQRLSKDTAAAFDRMRKAAAQDNISLQVVSGFRSISTQNKIFRGKGGGRNAAEYSAPPGHSQHHTGLAIDINSLQPSFRETAAFKWLHQHGAQYGFMLPYSNTQGDLGPRAEPWHWVYVAKLPAMQLMTSFVDRAYQHHYDPLLGDLKLAEIYRAATSLASQIPNKSKS
jgi:LAS superfamily LD-carboxypeptidase LdcB